MMCVGTDVRSSRESVVFCETHEGTYPVVGIHPHEAKDNNSEEIRQLIATRRERIVGVGEIGLDYFYDHSPRDLQQRVLREQLTIAREYGLPVSFHVRDAVRSDGSLAGEVFADFWRIIDDFPDIKGVLHSFTDSQANLTEALRRGFFIGINGIATFTKDKVQQAMYAGIDVSRILLETDAPFLTPAPFRGKMNSPAYVGRVAEHLAEQRHVSLESIVDATTHNAKELFGI